MPRETPAETVADISPGSFTQYEQYYTWRPAGSQDWLVIYTVDGMGEIAFENNKHQLKPGDLLLYEPDAYQDYRTDSKAGFWSLHWAHFQARDHWQRWLTEFPRLSSGIRHLHVPQGEIRDHIEECFQEIFDHYQSTLSYRRLFAMNALEKAWLWVRTLISDDPWPQLDPRIRKAMGLMEQALQKPPSLSELARSCNLSTSRFSHLFRDETGNTPHQYQENLRLAKARQLLETTSLRINEIAREVGYEDPFYFSNRFRNRFGDSPSGIRNAGHPT